MEIPLEGPKNPNYGKVDHRRKKVLKIVIIYICISILIFKICVELRYEIA